MAVLMIGGMDSSGGAGILRDCATAAAFGMTARVAVAAVTAQTDRAVLAVEMCRTETLSAQIQAAFDQGPVAAIKIGMLGTASAVEVVAQQCAAHPEVPVVLDPVIATSSGRALLDAVGVAALLDLLLPYVTVITPNLPECAQLAARLPLPLPLSLAVGEGQVATALMQRGAQAVLVKGGHDTGRTVVDHLFTSQGDHSFETPRHPGTLRGTGCALASGIACGLAQGHALPTACAAAQAHIRDRFVAAGF